jgi:protein gp37
MGKDSKIEWTHHTFNPWWGCTKVDPKCANCYALALSTRYGHNVWGPTAARRQMSADHWKQPLAWNAAAAKAGEHHRVFCASMADVFEGPETCQNADAYAMIQRERLRLFDIIRQTPNLDWLLLTKRPENVLPMINEAARKIAQTCIEDASAKARIGDLGNWLDDWWNEMPPANVWIGTSNEQDSQILAEIPAVVHFLSIEPLLGDPGTIDLRGIDWVITGGESGPGARPMHPDWARSVRDQCVDAGVSFFFKQWGEWSPGIENEFRASQVGIDPSGSVHSLRSVGLWPSGTQRMFRIGKKEAGRFLDGRTWDQIPEVR